MDYFDLQSLQLIVQKDNHFYSLPWCASDVQKRKKKATERKKAERITENKQNALLYKFHLAINVCIIYNVRTINF